MANEFKIKNGLVVSGSADIEQDLTVRGKIIADQLNISIVSSSVLYESGSTKFGDSIDDNHAFTGSVNITGSINLNGQAIGTGKLDETTFNTFTSSYKTVSGSINTRLGSLESFSSSINSNFVSEAEFGTYTGSLNSFTSSTLMTIGALNSESSSIRSNFNSFTSSYTNVSSSLDTRLDTLETLSGSFTGSFSGSFRGDGTNLFNIPASGVTGLNLTQIADGSVTASVSNTNGLRVNSKSEITGSLIVTNGITGSIDYSNITNKPTLVSGSSQIDITSTTGYSTFSSSISSSVGLLSSSVATTDSNQNTRLGNLETSTGSLNTFTSSASGRLTSLETTSGSINTFTASALTRVSAIETSTGSLNTFTSSASGRLTSLESASSSIRSDFNSFTSSNNSVESTQNSRLTSIESTTGSLNTFTSSASGRLTSLETTSGSINTFTSSALTRVSAIEAATSSLNTFTSSIATTIKNKLNTENVISGSIQVDITSTTGYSTFSSSISSSIGSLSSSIATTDSNQNTRLGNLETSTGSLNTFTSSALTRVSAIEAATSSLNSFTSSINTTIKTKLNSDNVVSGSSQIDITNTTGYSTFSSSLAATDLALSGRITVLDLKTGSYATTGSNVFKGNQTISGSFIITENLTVFGSSSITYVTSSQLRVDDNIITVNTASPGSRFGGLEVHDSGSIGIATGSILWDSVNNRWIYQQSSESTYGGGMLLSGPRSSGSLGSELSLTSGRVAKSAGGDHLNDSNITDNGTTVSINSNTEVTGSLLVTSTIVSQTTPLVSGSSQISFNGITDKPTLVSGSSQVLNGSGVWSGSAQLPSGVVSGSGQITYSGISGIPSGIVSGSSQIAFGSITGVPSGLVSGSSQVLSGTGIWSGSAQLPAGVVSGSSQIAFGSITGVPSGLVSGSSQVLVGTTIHSGAFFNGITVVSGSGQISFGGITGVPSGLVSGSSQIAYGSITGVPSGLVSGSSQITYGSLTGIPSGIVSGSSQIAFGSITGVPSGLVSGSSQIAFGSITGVPSGLVSGSSQISLASTTGFGTYLNQAVLTTSTPTFSTVSATTFTGALSGNATTANSAGVLTASGGLTTQYGNGTVGYSSALVNPQTGLFAAVDNSNSILTVNRHPDNYYSQLGFSSNGNLYYRSFSATAINTSQAWQTIWTSNSLTNLNQLTNGPGYITGITLSNVTTALGYTPYNSTNPNGYITGITFANVSSKPTTISGYGITDAITTANIGSQSVSSATSATFATNSSKLYSTDTAYSYTSGAPYYGFLTYDGTYWQFKVSPATPANVRVYTADTLGGYSYSNSSGANTIVQRDANGYIQNNYFNASGGGSERNASGMGYFAGHNSSDYYYRSYTAAAAAALLSGQAMNINGNATTATSLTSMNISQFTNNSGYITGVTNISGTAASETLSTVTGRGNSTAQNIVFSNGRKGLVGVYDAAQTQAIFAMGASYILTDGGSSTNIGNHYGLAWSYNPDYGGAGNNPQSKAGLNHQLLHMQAGVTTTAIGSGIWTNGTVTCGTVLPLSNNAYNLGSASVGWANVYTNDLHLSNMSKPEGNDVDGTNGTWTIQEGEENLYIINNRNGKKFKISLEEII